MTVPTEWRTIPGYEGRYEVSEDGQVRTFLDSQGGICSMPRARALSRAAGRLSLALAERPKVQRMRTVHSLVALAFLGPRPPGLTVNHKDGNKDNNHWTNLEYLTHKENRDHATQNGFLAHGERVNTAKLTAEKVRNLREKRAAGATLKTLSKEFGISIAGVHGITSGKSWRRIA